MGWWPFRRRDGGRHSFGAAVTSLPTGPLRLPDLEPDVVAAWPYSLGAVLDLPAAPEHEVGLSALLGPASQDDVSAERTPPDGGAAGASWLDAAGVAPVVEDLGTWAVADDDALDVASLLSVLPFEADEAWGPVEAGWLAVPDLAVPDLAVPDVAVDEVPLPLSPGPLALAVPDLAVPDVPVPDLAVPDLAVPDVAVDEVPQALRRRASSSAVFVPTSPPARPVDPLPWAVVPGPQVPRSAAVPLVAPRADLDPAPEVAADVATAPGPGASPVDDLHVPVVLETAPVPPGSPASPLAGLLPVPRDGHDAGRVLLGFRDGSTHVLASGSEPSRALQELARILLARS